MPQDQTKMYHGPMKLEFGTVPIVVSPINDSHVKLTLEIKESSRETTDGRELASVTGRKLGFEITFDEILGSDMDAIEAKKGEDAVVTFLDKSVNDILTIENVEHLTTSGSDLTTMIKGFVTGDAESAWDDLFTITTTV